MSCLTPEEIARIRSKYGWEVWPLADMVAAQAARIAELERESNDLLVRLHRIIGVANDDDGPEMDEWALEDPEETVRSLRSDFDELQLAHVEMAALASAMRAHPVAGFEPWMLFERESRAELGRLIASARERKP